MPAMEQMQKRWGLASAVLGALAGHYRPPMMAVAKAAGLREWGILMVAWALDPQPVAADRLRMRMPYVAPQRYEKALAALAASGYLNKVHAGFRMSDEGRALVERLVDAAYAAMAELEPLPKRQLEEVSALLRKLVDAIMSQEGGPDLWSITVSRRTDPGPEAPVMVRIDQCLSDLNAYRDDAHLAAWEPTGVSGHGWEALTLIWRDQAKTTAELADQLDFRGWGAEQWADALERLELRGWLHRDGDRYSLTEEGRQARHEAEDRTDRLFYAPWYTCSEGELQRLETLLAELLEHL